MSHYLNLFADSTLIVGGSTIAAIAGVWWVRQRFEKHDFKQHHEVAGYLMSVVGTLYAVLLGLIVVNVQGKFDQARIMAQTEANACSDIYQITRGFPKDVRHAIRADLKNYYVVVQNEDWEGIAMGEVIEQSVPAYQRMWHTVSEYQPAGNRESACYSNLLNTMQQLSDARRYRLFACKRGLSPIVWVVLTVGGVLTVLFTYFFWVRSTKTQLTLIAFVALFLSLNVLLVKLFDDPYRAELGIQRSSFSFKPSIFDDDMDGTGIPASIKAPDMLDPLLR